MSRFRSRQKRGVSGIVVSLVLILVIIALGFLYTSSMFERNIPKIDIASRIDWNLKSPLKLKLSDDSGIKFVRVRLGDGDNTMELFKKVYSDTLKSRTIDIEFPRRGLVGSNRSFRLIIDVIDSSKWNFLSGNSAQKVVDVRVDRRRPEVFIVNNSYKIIKGGVASVVFKAKDKNLKELYIETNFGKRFYPTPFYKKDYFISLIAWPVEQKKFRAAIVAKDRAGNLTKVSIKLFYLNKRYKISKIPLKDRFLDGKISDLIAENRPQLDGASRVEKFKYVNETLRDKNEKTIEKYTTPTDKKMVSSFYQKRFYPLRNAKAVASFGDHRYYSYNGERISEAWHLGLDLASIAGAKIKTQNSGVVVFADVNGIYGNNLILYHGLGLYTLYGHCSNFLVGLGDRVKAGQVIAKTGSTGLALGDHLHFGVLVQGVEVRPEEWMDKSWMKTNIFNIIKTSKKMIDKK